MQKIIRAEINLLRFDTKVFFNTCSDAFVKRRGVCIMLVAKLCQGRTFAFKSNFNLFWKSVSCHTQSNHVVLCTNGSASSSVSFHMEILLAITLSGSDVCSMAENVAGGAASSCCPCLLNYVIFPFSFKTCFSVVCRCFPHKFQ